MSAPAGYVNPFGTGLQRGRVDMGVDYSGKGFIFSIGDAVVERVSPQGTHTGWPGSAGSGVGAMIVYRLTSGPRKGEHVYLAENVDPVKGLKVGDVLKPGQPIATARGAYPFLESGFSDALGQPINHATYTEGQQTAGGKDFASFTSGLKSLPSLNDWFKTHQPPDVAAGGVANTAGEEAAATGAASALAKGVIGVLWDAIGADAMRALLYVVLVGGGLALAYAGTKRTLGAQEGTPA